MLVALVGRSSSCAPSNCVAPTRKPCGAVASSRCGLACSLCCPLRVWARALLGLWCCCRSWCYSLRAPCLRCSCCCSWCGSWRSGASGRSPGCSSVRGCCSLPAARRGRAGSLCFVAPSFVRARVGPSALLRSGTPKLCCLCGVCWSAICCAGGGEDGTPSGRVDGRFAWP